jgi:small-conductance mechanosensitive channel
MSLNVNFRSRCALLVLVPVLAVLGSTLAPAAARAQDAAAAPEADIPTAAVRFDERTLFTVRGTSSYPAPVRAAAIAERIRGVARDATISPDSLEIVPSGIGLDIRAGNTVLIGVVPADANLESVRLETLASAHKRRIGAAIAQYREDREPRKLLRGLGLALLASLVFVALTLFLRVVFRRLGSVLERRVQAQVATFPKGGLQFVQGKQLWDATMATLRGVHLILVLVLVYFWLEFVLVQFPWTRGVGEQLLGFVVDPLTSIGEGFLDFVPNLLFLIVLVIVIRYGLRLFKLYFSALERGTAQLSGFEPAWSMPAYKLVRALAIALALVMAYPYLPGAGSEALQGVSVFAGLLLSLGATSAVGNLIAGYINTFGRVFRLGDIIKVGDVTGEVTETRLLTTRVRTIKNEEVTIPNGTIINNQVVNYSALAASRGLILHTEVGIGYEVPWRQVHAMLEEAARRTPGLLPDPPPFILQRQLGDFAVVYQLNGYSGTARGMATIRSTLHQNVLDVFNEYGVQIMTPAYEGDTPEPKVVPRDNWYAAPARPPTRGGTQTSDEQ